MIKKKIEKSADSLNLFHSGYWISKDFFERWLKTPYKGHVSGGPLDGVICPHEGVSNNNTARKRENDIHLYNSKG